MALLLSSIKKAECTKIRKLFKTWILGRLDRPGQWTESDSGFKCSGASDFLMCVCHLLIIGKQSVRQLCSGDDDP